MRRRGSRRCGVGAAVLGLGGSRRLDRTEGGGGEEKVFVGFSHTVEAFKGSVVLESNALCSAMIRGYETTRMRKLKTKMTYRYFPPHSHPP